MIRPRASCSWRRPASQNVVLAEVLAGAGPECLAALGDELFGAGQLGGELGQERGVGGELVAGQAGIPLAAQLPGRQQAPAVGQDPVGPLVQLEHVVEVTRVGVELAGVGGELAVAQELGLVGGGQGFRVDHRHFRRQVAEVALHHVQRDPGVEQAGGLGMPETVGAVEVDHSAGGVAHVQPPGQLRQQVAEPAGRVGAVAVTVVPRRQEQVLRRGDR